MAAFKCLSAFLLSFMPIFACAVESVQPKEFESGFGFKARLDSGWVMLGPSQAKKEFKDIASLALLGIDQEEASTYFERIRSGKVEYYLDAFMSDSTFRNNVSVQLMHAERDYSSIDQEGLNEICTIVKEELFKVWGAPVVLDKCLVQKAKGVAFLALIYLVEERNIFIVQYEVPLSSNEQAVIVGGARPDNQAAQRVVNAASAIVVGIAGRTGTP
jgi:hypothetical protein